MSKEGPLAMRIRPVMVAIIGALVLAACGDSEGTAPAGTGVAESPAANADTGGSSPASGASSVDAGAFYLEYDRDPEATEAKYLGEQLTVTGMVSAFGTNADDVAYINLLVSRIQCVFDEPGPPAVFSRLNLGLTYTVSGTVEFRTEPVRDETGLILQRPPGKILTLVDCQLVQ